MKKKRVFKLLIFLIMFLNIFFISKSYAANIISKDGKWEYFVKNNEIHLCDYLGSNGTIEIPKTIDGYEVAYIESFIGNKVIENIKIPSTVKSMGSLMGAFQGCKNLKEVEIEEGNLKNIPMFTFMGCSNLTNIIIPDSINKIANYAFLDCENLETFNIGVNIEEIGVSSFGGCKKLSTININSKNKNFVISDGILYDNNKTQIIFYPLTKTDTEYSVPKTVETLKIYNIENEFIEKINIHSELKKIAINTFGLCSNLKQIETDEKNTIYCDEDGILFNKDKSSLIYYPQGKEEKTYVIPNTVTHIEAGAFSGNNNINRLIIKNTVTNIEKEAIQNCENLVIYCNKGTVAEQYAIENNIDYQIIKGIVGDKYIYEIDEDKKNCKIVSYIGNEEKVIILEKIDSYTVNKIEYNAFLGNTKITYVQIPKTIENIGINAFSACENLEEIKVDNSNLQYCDEDGILFNKNKTELICFPAGKQMEENKYEILETVTKISVGAFQGNRKLKNIIIGKNVTTIDNDAFSVCVELENIDVDNNNSKYATENGVLFNKNKTDLICYPTGKKDNKYEVLNTVTNIIDFRENNYLEEIILGENVDSIIQSGFAYCSNLKKIDLSKSKIEYIRDSVFYNCEKLEIIKFSEKLRSIGKYAFANCKKIKELKFTDTVEYVGIGAFANCSNLENIDFNNITQIGNNSFENCAGLKEITISEKIKNIFSEAFLGCTNLEKTTIYSRDIKISDDVFEECPNLKIYCYKGSTAEQYAIENNINYEIIDSNNITVQFKDIALYNFMKLYLNSRYSGVIESVNDENKQIVIGKENILKIDLINMEGKGIQDLSGLENFTNLHHLYASNNKIQNIEPLKNLKQMQMLLLNNNNIKNIDSLENLTKITELQLDNNQVTKINSLSNLNCLDRVFLSGNKVMDISPLNNLSNLSLLVINDNCYIEDQIRIEVIKNQEKIIDLPTVFLYAKKQGSLIYTPTNLEFTNCKIVDNKIVLNTINLGENIATIVIKDGNAKNTTYKIKYTVIDEDNKINLGNLEVITKENVNYIKVEENMTISKIKEIITKVNEGSNLQIQIIDEKRKEIIEGETIKTNYTIKLTKGRSVKEYKTVKRGYINSDDKITVSDLMKLLVHLAEEKAETPTESKLLKGAYLIAADITENGKIDMFDILPLVKLAMDKLEESNNKEDIKEPAVELIVSEELKGSKIRIKTKDETELAYITYKWITNYNTEDEQEEKEVRIDLEPGTIETEQEIEIKRGTNKIIVTAFDTSGNYKREDAIYSAKLNPDIIVYSDETKLHMKIIHDMGFEKVEICVNGQIYTYDKNYYAYNPAKTELYYSFNLKEGENQVAIIATSNENTQATYAGKTICP